LIFFLNNWLLLLEGKSQLHLSLIIENNLALEITAEVVEPNLASVAPLRARGRASKAIHRIFGLRLFVPGGLDQAP
jgi:hypothetical protein